jgi:site-specific DNA-adenine methylase
MSDKKNNIEQNLNEELFVNDLNDSLGSNIDDVLEMTKKLIENIESTIQDNEIRNETKEILKNFSKSLSEYVEPTRGKFNNEIIQKNNSKEEE